MNEQDMLAEIAQYRIELEQVSAEARAAVVQIAAQQSAHFFFQTEDSGQKMWDALRDLLSVSWRMATAKARKRRPTRAFMWIYPA